MEMEFVSLLSQFAFPIAVSVFVLVRMEQTIKKNTEAIISLKEEIIRRKK